MQFTLASLTTIAAFLSATALAAPQSKRQTTPFEYRSLTLKLSSGPASYTLDLKADGQAYETSMYLSLILLFHAIYDIAGTSPPHIILHPSCPACY